MRVGWQAWGAEPNPPVSPAAGGWPSGFRCRAREAGSGSTGPGGAVAADWGAEAPNKDGAAAGTFGFAWGEVTVWPQTGHGPETPARCPGTVSVLWQAWH